MSHKLLTSCRLCPQVRMLSWNISRPKQWQWNTEAHNLPMNSEQEQELSVCVCVCANGSEHVYCMSDGGKLGWPWGGQHAFFVLQPCFHSWSLRSRAAPGCTFKMFFTFLWFFILGSPDLCTAIRVPCVLDAFRLTFTHPRILQLCVGCKQNSNIKHPYWSEKWGCLSLESSIKIALQIFRKLPDQRCSAHSSGTRLGKQKTRKPCEKQDKLRPAVRTSLFGQTSISLAVNVNLSVFLIRPRDLWWMLTMKTMYKLILSFQILVRTNYIRAQRLECVIQSS